MFFSSIAILILYFISFVILARVYASKNKEYTILRTLGIAKKDMRDIVLFEVMSMTTCITVGTYLLALIIRLFTTKGVFEVFTTISPFASILYFIIMMLFGYFTARGFNRKLFKFSVNKTFKRKEARHD